MKVNVSEITVSDGCEPEFVSATHAIAEQTIIENNGGCLMDNSKEFHVMFDAAIRLAPTDFTKFDRAKNVQDQFQEMLYQKTLLEPPRICNLFNDWLEKEWFYDEEAQVHHWRSLPFTSISQLWFAFTMRELCGKVWTGEDWVEEVAVIV